MTEYPACQTLEVIKLHLGQWPQVHCLIPKTFNVTDHHGSMPNRTRLDEELLQKNKKLKSSEKLHKVGWGDSERNSQELGGIFS